ncbi:TrlF family AAA-like ATPase [Pseudomonas sp. RC2C2]|uniref:TrlF family AAA-like ATPase n=1 Tax=Pseudomonas sp. RC2C2 TaxID=2834408 RepID=UPI001BD007B3|nr:AAA family ATPase [Pseudomonas sp. RC2C2]MBS7596899.1 AAA family ATPase [Pseudomonas sp. RC2C2]
MGDYQGMRWFKTDFQVQTPEDNRHWADDDLRLHNRRPLVDGKACELGIQEKAKRFLRRCHELELEMIGITDHNFSERSEPRDWFLTHLVEQNKSVARELGRDPLAIFPGFEVDIGYHVLCLFQPARKQLHIQRLHMILTKLGLAEHERFRAGAPMQLRREGRTLSLKELIEVVQHHDGIVIAAHADQADGILSSANNIADYQIPQLLAVEVTTYPMPPKIRSILDGSNRDWSRRGRQPAYVQSSDAKSLAVGEDGRPLPNSLGYRSTWVKASKPSIAALRQAFQDGPSRLRIQENRPSDEQTHPRIVFLKCRGLTFLADQEVHFSPNLNTIIGGRGTGKSTLMELLRFAFARDTAGQFSASIKAKFERLRETFSGDAEIQIGWEGGTGQVDIISLRPDDTHQVVQGEVVDIAAYLKQIPIQFYSQQQLSDLTNVGGESSLLSMLDEACIAELQALKARESTLRAEILQVFAASDQLDELRKSEKEVAQQLSELNRQWQARKEIQAEALLFQRAEAGRQYFEKARAQFTEDAAAIALTAEKLAQPGILNDGKIEIWPRVEWFNNYTDGARALRQRYSEQLSALMTSMQREAAELERRQDGWDAVSAELAAIKDGFLQACQDRGLQPQDVARLQEIDKTRQVKQESLERLQKQIAGLAPAVEKLSSRLDELHTLWAEQLAVRSRTAEEITQKANRSINILIQPMGDEADFQAVWEGLAPDGRARIGRVWTRIGTVFFADFHSYMAANKPAAYSPWLHIKTALTEKIPVPQELVELAGDIRKHFVEQKEKWRAARLHRIEDQVDLELFRADGTLVGSIQSRALSEGQRNTAVLKLLLAQGDGPIVIDQPEDELDSNFIYHELVPLLRKVKNRRQLILATHNANLPVNADTDLVYALDVKKGRGERLAVGGLDQTDTANAVLNIMEGSAEAFKRRFDKYHF